MAQPTAERVKPTDRRWVLVGMAAGTGIGLLPAVLPEPIGPFLLWVCCGALAGFAIPSATVLVLILLIDQNKKAWWWMSGVGAAIGAVVGVVLAVRGDPLPEAAVMFAGTCGFLVGFAVAEVYLRRLDVRKRQQSGRIEDSPVAEPSAAPDRAGG